MQPQDARTGDLDISAGSQLLDCPRLWPEPAHTYSGWSLSSWAAAAISSAGRGFSAFLHLLLTSFLLGWAGGWGVQVPPVPSACQGGDALSKPDGRQRGCFPADLLKGACSRAWEPGDSAPPARHHGGRHHGCFCPSGPAADLCLTGMSRQTPALQLAVSPAPTPWRPATLGAPTERVAAALSGVNRCPYLGWLWVLPCRPGFPRCPFCLGLLSPLLPVGLHLLPLCRQLPDLLEGTETQQQAGLVSAPGGASFGSDPRCCPLPQPLGRQRFAPNRSGAVESCQAPQLTANAAE